ncbi:MAG: hypothetical protein QXU82_03170 [Candidatus Aenigmatarchaeota archaeon]
MKMKITVTDILIVLLIVTFVYFSLNEPRYFQTKGNDLFGASMTYKTLIGKGYGADAEISGIGSDFGLKSVKGPVIDATATRIYVWDGARVQTIFQKDEKNPLAEGLAPQTPYITSSIITLKPTDVYRFAEAGCEGADFTTETLYLDLDKDADSVVCSYVSKKLWDSFGGEVSCAADGMHAMLEFSFAHGFSADVVESALSDFGYRVIGSRTLSQKCLVLK